jgi:hypothetical protein
MPAEPPAQACSNGTVQLITLSSSARGIGDGPGVYSIGLKCTWVVNASGPITLRFNELQTTLFAHYVTLYDGASTSDPELARFSGPIAAVRSDRVTSTGGAMTIVFTSPGSLENFGSSSAHEGFAATLTTSVVADASQLVGTLPTTVGDLRCIGSVTRMCAHSCYRSPAQSVWTLRCCRDLSGQNLTGPLPDSLLRMRMLSSMYAQRSQ